MQFFLNGCLVLERFILHAFSFSMMEFVYSLFPFKVLIHHITSTIMSLERILSLEPPCVRIHYSLLLGTAYTTHY